MILQCYFSMTNLQRLTAHFRRSLSLNLRWDPRLAADSSYKCQISIWSTAPPRFACSKDLEQPIPRISAFRSFGASLATRGENIHR